MKERARTLDEVLRLQAALGPEQPCVSALVGPEALTRGQLAQAAAAFARHLLERGVQRGARVVLGFGNTPSFFSALFGCFASGTVAVPLDPCLADRELRAILKQVSPSAIVVDAPASKRFADLAEACPVIGVDAGFWARLEPAAPAAQHAVSAEPESPALILYTSGTTGGPKGVVCSHAGLMSKAAGIAEWFGIDRTFRSLCLLPTHFGHGLIANCLSTLSAGGSLVVGPPFNLDLLQNIWEIVRTRGISNFSTVPTIVRLLIELGARGPVSVPSCLKYVTCASSPLSAAEVERFETLFGVPLLNCYGLTETGSWSACSPLAHDRNRKSVGFPVACEVRVVDSAGQVRSAGEKGELQIKGPAVMKEYHAEPALTGAVLTDGWFSTGDIGEVDESGAVFLHARVKDVVIRAGKNIYPAEVDAALLSHPSVLEACSLGVADPLLGERVMSCVVCREASALTEASLLLHLRDYLAAYKCPERIVFVSSLPRTSRGKVNRAEVRLLLES